MQKPRVPEPVTMQQDSLTGGNKLYPQDSDRRQSLRHPDLTDFPNSLRSDCEFRETRKCVTSTSQLKLVFRGRLLHCWRGRFQSACFPVRPPVGAAPAFSAQPVLLAIAALLLLSLFPGALRPPVFTRSCGGLPLTRPLQLLLQPAAHAAGPTQPNGAL